MTIDEAISRVEELSDEYETERKRTYLFVAFDHELKDENGLKFCSYDPFARKPGGSGGRVYVYDKAWVDERYDDGEVFSDAVHDRLSSEDYQALDLIDGAQEAIQRVLSILRSDQ